MGSVWLAEHVTLHAHVAVKLLDVTMAQTKDGLTRFLREAQSAAGLRSPHIVQILDHGIDQGQPYIAMELLEGESLGARLDREGRLSPSQTASIINQVARAMTRAHAANVVHRDLKPDNIFLVPNDDEEVVKVLDFGIAKAATPLAGSISDSTRTGTMLGTPYYMSPEQVESAASADFRTDIWAMGVIAFQGILGRRPFDGETIGSLFLAICSKDFPVPSRRGDVPLGFDAWFSRCCARDPAQRFQSARDAAAELRRLSSDGVTPSVDHDADAPQLARSFGNTTGQNAAVGYSAAPKLGRQLMLLPLLALVVSGAVVGAWVTLKQTSAEASSNGGRAAIESIEPVAAAPAASVAASVTMAAPLPTTLASTPAQPAPATSAAPARPRPAKLAVPKASPPKQGQPRGEGIDLGL